MSKSLIVTFLLTLPCGQLCANDRRPIIMLSRHTGTAALEQRRRIEPLSHRLNRMLPGTELYQSLVARGLEGRLRFVTMGNNGLGLAVDLPPAVFVNFLNELRSASRHL